MSTGAAAALLLSLIAAEPRVLDSRFELQQVASEPDLVTPIGLTFDGSGRLLVIESHTHFRPEGYQGPAKDRIRLVEDTDGDGRADQFRTYYEGTEATMGIRTGPDGWVYVATRGEVFRLRDGDGDGQAEERQDVARLETRGRYPHNGLSGLAFSPDGKLYFGLGENLGEPYVLIGKDGNSLEGGGEGGNVFRCDPDGAKLERYATGFWNPFGLCFDPFGRLFAVDNDPDASPPCRLIHVVPGGDYGFQFRYGRGGRHPLQAWSGELPGTLPMVAGTGEAPCAVLPHEGTLWVSSWGENRIERYTLRPQGASVVGTSEIVVQGDQSFRPVDFAIGSDGAIYFTDWVDKSYPLHGQGGLWRLSTKADASPVKTRFPELSEAERHAAEVRSKIDLEALASDDPFLRQAAVQGLVEASDLAGVRWSELESARQRVGFLLARRERGDLSESERDALLEKSFGDADPSVRLTALRWVSDARLVGKTSAVEKLLATDDITADLFRATVATLDWLDRDEKLTKTDDPLARLTSIVDDSSRPTKVRSLALSLIPADHSALTVERLGRLVEADDAALRREAVRALAVGNAEGRFKLLAAIAKNVQLEEELRADAVVGLAADVQNQARLLNQLAESETGVVAEEAKRALSTQPAEKGHLPAADDRDAWLNLVGSGGDPNAGWRVFFRPSGVACSRCHMLGGRGNNVGPDLTTINRQATRERLLESMLQPSKEIAPQYVPWVVVTKDGQVLTGVPINLSGVPGERETFVDAEGKRFDVLRGEIDSRHASPTSIMPGGLEKAMTAEELRDLLALLTEGRAEESR